MTTTSNAKIPDAAEGWPRIWHAEKSRYRQLECDHAVQDAIRARNLAIQLIRAAQADHILSREEADALRAKIE